MTDNRKVQLGAEFDAGGVKQGTQQAKDAVRDLARDVQASAQQAGDAPKIIGDGFKKAALEADRADKNITAGLQRQIARFESAGKGARAYQEALIIQRGLDPARFEPYLAALDKADQAQRKATGSLGQMGISAGQTQAALRQLPAQFTDIFTSLASGQAPMMVLIQQGGQIKDSFGGIGAAVRGIASAISPAIVGLTALAGVAATLAWAYGAGAKEDAEFRRSLVLTGNAAGTTQDGLRGMAQAVSAVVGTEGQAAAVLAQLTGLGIAGAAGFEKMTEAAIRLERVGGPAAEKTVEAFAKLAKDPLKASIELNESTNFLTVSLYKQIKALEEAGDKAGAAAVASKAFAGAMLDRGKELEDRMGSIERGWLHIKDAISGAKDALLEIGREATKAERLQELDQRIAALKGVQQNKVLPSMSMAFDPRSYAQQLAAAQSERDALQKTMQAAQGVAAAQAERAAATKQAIEADKEAKKHASELAAEERKRIGLIAELNGLQTDYGENLARLAAMRKSGRLTEEQYVEAINKLIQKQPFALELERQRNQAAERHSKLLKEEAEAERKRIDGITGQIEALTRQKEALDDEFVELTRGKEAREAVVQLRMDEAAAIAQSAATTELAAKGYTLEWAKLQTLADALKDVADARRRNTERAATNAWADDLAKQISESQRATQQWVDSVGSGLTDAFRRAFESGQDFGTAFARTIGNEVKAQLAAALAQALTNQALAALFGSAVSGATGSAAGGTNWLQMASTASSLYNAGNGGGLAGWAANTSYGKAFSAWLSGSSASGGVYLGTATGADLSAAYATDMAAVSSAGASGASSVASAMSTAAPYIAWAVAAYLVSSKAYSEGFTSQNQDSKFWESPLSGEVTNAAARLFTSLGIGSDSFNQIFSGAAGFNYLFGRGRPNIESQGFVGTLAGGALTDDQLYADIKQKGGLFRSDKSWTEYAAMPDDLARFMDEAAKSVFDHAKDFGAALGLPAEQLASVTQQIKITLTDDAAENQKAITAALGGYGEALVDAWADAVAPLQQYGETTAATITRVGAAILGVNGVLDTLGLAALKASVDGGKAALTLQTLFGDLAGLQASAGSYLQNYYTDAERSDLTRTAIGDALGQVNLALPETRDAFRALVQAQDLMTDSGQKAFAVLLGVSDAFASITPSAQDLAATLAQAAAALASERQNLQVQLWQAQGDTAALAAYDRSKIAPENLDLYDELQRLKAEQTAAALAQQQREAASAAQQAWEQAATAAAEAASQVRQQWLSVADAISNEIKRLRGLGGANAAGAGGFASAQSAFAIATAQARAGDASAAQQLPALSQAYSQAAETMATSSADLAVMIARIAASLDETRRLAALRGAPGFADGGSFAGGLRIVGERGPEAEVTGPARIYTFEQLMRAAASGGSNADLQAELQAVRAELQGLREDTALLSVIARNTGLGATVLDEAARGKRGLKTVAGS